MVAALEREGEVVNRKHVVRLMQQMGLVAIYPREQTSQVAVGHKIYPYLLRNLKVDRINQVWSTDITYIRLARGFVYLAAVINWYSRYVLSWTTSVTLDVSFCLEALEGALCHGCPEIFNTDQGSQFTSAEFTGRLKQAGISISMDGRGRALDNIFVERLWRSVKYEEVYLNDYSCVPEAVARLDRYLRFYNTQRLHQSLSYRTPAEVHCGEGAKVVSR